ncbi:uncharacterized protein LTR77_008102 [Saxophila tyrrhenica]|uniref:Beta-lactamase-related domain-containing protein n=1 Tax=Saxophila tyrrhenica TaxID=1690608 RepID=A0AAV9P5S4_9PEZI|nr:hypothetical protein LTR77_008102 [Saxophila tyrrhenica]
MSTAKGHCDPAFEAVKQLLSDNVASDTELGACVCVNVDGKNVVDIWDGYIDKDKTIDWQENSIINVWSCSKTVTNLAVLICHDRGLLDVNEPIAKYWPEFAENGKKDIPVKHILSHSTGLAGWENADNVSLEDVCDPTKSTPPLAKQAPWWTPGTASGYHAMNQGHLAGELVRRVTGKTLKQFIAEDIAGPLGADFQLGAVEKDWDRISTLLAPPSLVDTTGASLDPNSVAMRALTNPGGSAEFALGPEWRRGEVGAANGHGNARALVRILSIITRGGEVDGVKLLSPQTIDLIFQEQTNGMDLVLGKPIRFGIGYGLPLPEFVPMIREGRVCFWGGWGGSSIIMDLDRKLTISYVMNKMGAGTVGNPRTEGYINTIYDCVAKMGGERKA